MNHAFKVSTVIAAMAGAGLGLARLAGSQVPTPLPTHTISQATPLSVLLKRVDDSVPNAAQIRRGQYLVIAGDCMSCHLRDGGEPLAGGLGLKTPFGVIYTSNITADEKTGIGAWTPEQFHGAMHDGVDDDGNHLYPAFPYPWFRLASREDDDAILAYLKTTPPVDYEPPKNNLHFPMNVRSSVKFWNWLYLDKDGFKPDAAQSAEWNRGAYLVNGLGHCGACHTPKTPLGGDDTKRNFHGGNLDNWIAPDLTGNTQTGLGAWSVEDIAEYLHTGRNARAGAGAAMADVITYSTSLMTDEDRKAIAVYLKSQAASPSVAAGRPDRGAMRRGAEIYSDACASCHLENGVGQPRYFPPLGDNAMVQQRDATGLEHMILSGSRIGTSPSRPSPMTMPSFAWKLTDSEIADVVTYIRNSWGNHAAPVSSSAVSDLRKKLDLGKERLTVNSGDRN